MKLVVFIHDVEFTYDFYCWSFSDNAKFKKALVSDLKNVTVN
jgi:hypothetical protein